MVDYLVYASVREPNCGENEINNILASANRNNASLNITGVLLYNQKRFLQYLEGEKEVIKNLYEKIKSDSRHNGVTLFGMNKRDQRIFPTWAMAGKNAEDVELRSSLSKQDEKVFEDILAGKEKKEDRAMQVIHRLFG